MWLWGLAASVPIIIHLWNRRNYRQMKWAAMEYLMAAIRKNSRRIQIEQLILLMIRALVILLVATAWVDLNFDLGSTVGGLTGVGTRTHTVLVLDGSYSMAYRQADPTSFERAKQMAVEKVEQAGPGDGFTLILMADPPQVIIGQPAFDPQDVMDVIENIQLRHHGADLVATLAETKKLIATVLKKHSGLPEHEVCFFTDLQSRTWEPATSGALTTKFEELGKLAHLSVVDLGTQQSNNMAISGLVNLEPYVTVGREVHFQAEVTNFSDVVKQQQLEFFVDDQRVRQEQVEVGPHAQVSVGVAHRFQTPGEHTVHLILDGDRLEVDNHRWLSVPVRESLRVLCVHGRPGAARSITLALSPLKTDTPEIRTETVSENILLERELSNYDAIFLCNVARLSRDEAGVLQRYLQQGGGLITFLGDQINADSYNQYVISKDNTKGFLPARLGEDIPAGNYKFDPRDYQHPIVELFRGHERTGLLSTPVAKYVQLEVDTKTSARTALWFDGGDAAIVEQQVGRGRSILLATAASGDSTDRSTVPPTPWTAMTAWHSFPPLVQELLAYAVAGQADSRNIQVGQPLGSSVHSNVANLLLEVISPDETSRRVRPIVDGQESSWSFGETDVSGIYAARFGAPLNSEQLFAVNVDTRESKLRRIDVAELPSQLRRQAQAEEGEQASGILGVTQSSIFRYLLAALFGLLMVETFFAWKFGSGTS